VIKINDCIVIGFLFIFLLTIGCSTPKAIESTIPTPNRTKEEILTALANRNIDFQWFAAKASASFDSPDMGGSGSIQMRIKKDEAIWMVGKKFGIEGVRALINKDSIFLVNRIDQSYNAERINDVQKIFGLDVTFEDMQQLFVGNILIPSNEEIINYEQVENLCNLSANTGGYKIVYTLDAKSKNLKEITMADRYGRKIIATYDNYKKIKNHMTPYLRKYIFRSINEPDYVLDLEVSDLEIDVEKSLNFTVPSHYDRVRL
jgi:hypothetical protein